MIEALYTMGYQRDHRICHRRMATDRPAFLAGLEPQHLEPAAVDDEQD